jgi:hypothetical protein
MHSLSKPGLLLITIFGGITFLGCTSIKSKPLSNDGHGNWYSSANLKGTKGVPCKLKIAKGTRVNVLEQIAVFADGRVAPFGYGKFPEAESIKVFEVEDIKEDLYFMVHIPRPVAGTLEIGSEDKPGYKFNSDGYLIGLGAKIVDTTIQDVTSVVKALTPSKTTTSTNAEKEAEPKVEYVIKNRLVATRDFYWDDPNWQIEMNQWIESFESGNQACQNIDSRLGSKSSEPVVRKMIR